MYLSSLQVKEESENVADEVLQSSCELVLEWAHKLLNQQFSNIKSLAEYLVSSNYVNGRSMAAFTVLANQNNEGGGPKTPVSTAGEDQCIESECSICCLNNRSLPLAF